LRGNRSSKSTFLDEIDDPHGDYSRAGAAGYDKGPEYPYTMEDVRRHDAEVKGLRSEYTNLGSASSSSVPRQESSSSTLPADTSRNIHACEHGVKTLKPRKAEKGRTFAKPKKWRPKRGRQKARSLNSKWEKR
jgi:hypothetical protein